MTRPSGKFVVRIEPQLHDRLKRLAAAASISLNEMCAQQLEFASGRPSTPEAGDLNRVIIATQGMFGDDLIGIVLYGSWINGRATPSSDVDLLVVLGTGTPVRRSAYDPWQSLDLRIDGHLVEPAIVALPKSGSLASGFWAEIATEGLLVWWSDWTLHNYLTQVRSDIAAGKLRRQRSHGQSYWVRIPGSAVDA